MVYSKYLHKNLLCALVLGTTFLGIARADDSSIQLFTYKTHSRLSFNVDDGVEPVWKDTASGFEILFKGLSLSDLGAPLGGEESWTRAHEALIQKRGDPRIGQLAIQEVPGAIKITGKWKFPKGDLAPAQPKMEKFDFRDKGLVARYVVDFWVKKGPTVADLKAERKKIQHAEETRRAEEKSKQRKLRRLAAESAKADAADIGKFCREPLSEKQDVFLAFQPFHEKINLSRWFPTTTADSNYIYLEPKSHTADANYVRLALDLYRQGRPALVLRTLEFFEAEHPDSSFAHEMRFLKANAMIKLGFQVDALRHLNDLMITAKDSPSAKDSPVALHAAMYLAAKAFDQGNDLLALESFLWLANRYPGHRLNWVFHLGAAESLYNLKETDRAAKEYQWIVLNAPNRMAQAEGAVRMGDLYLARRQYERALAAYYQAISHYKEEVKSFPAVHLNRAESLYWLEQYDRAEESFKQIVTAYGAHPATWRATFRLGEISGRKTDEAASAESRKWFYETINRYPFSAGATLARIRLLPCGDHGGFDVTSADRFYTAEAEKFTGNSEVFMERYHDFRSLARVRSLVTFGREDMAVSAAIEELKANNVPVVRGTLTGLLDFLFKKSIMTMLADGKNYEALAFYRDRAALIPDKGSEDPDYLLRLSQVASDLGMSSMAQSLVEKYRRKFAAQNEGRAIATVVDEADLRLRVSEQKFTEAKALWVGASADIAKMRELLSGVVDESKFSYEKELMLALFEEKDGNFASALKHALKAQLLMTPEEDRPRVEAWIASLHERVGNVAAAAELYQKILKLDRKSVADDKTPDGKAAILGVPPLPSLEASVVILGDLFVKQGKWGEAAGMFGRAVKDGLGGNHMVYRYAQALDKTGEPSDKQKSKAELEKLAGSKTDDFWKKLARETLAPREGNAKEGRK